MELFKILILKIYNISIKERKQVKVLVKESSITCKYVVKVVLCQYLGLKK